MADGMNEARALRVLEIANDFRTLQVHIQTLQPRITPPDPTSQSLPGYQVARELNAQSKLLFENQLNPGSLVPPGSVPADDAQKANLQRIILDMSCRRWRAHGIYLKLAAAVRWVQMRNQVLKGEKQGPQHAREMQAIDGRLRQEIQAITDQHVYQELRSADTRKGYWVNDDPNLERILAYLRTQPR